MTHHKDIEDAIAAAEQNIISIDEIKKHRSRDNCWIILENFVLDISNYLSKHPGGDSILFDYRGTDISDIFAKISHSDKAYSIAMKMSIGIIKK